MATENREEMLQVVGRVNVEDIPHHYTWRVFQAGKEWSWVIEDGGCVVMRGGGCASEYVATATVDEELRWLDPERSA